LERYHPNIHSLAKQGSFRGEAAFSVQIFPWETDFMNNALWSPRGAQAGERTRTAGGTTTDTVSLDMHVSGYLDCPPVSSD
jgi:hypothetical protein